MPTARTIYDMIEALSLADHPALMVRNILSILDALNRRIDEIKTDVRKESTMYRWKNTLEAIQLPGTLDVRQPTGPNGEVVQSKKGDWLVFESEVYVGAFTQEEFAARIESTRSRKKTPAREEKPKRGRPRRLPAVETLIKGVSAFPLHPPISLSASVDTDGKEVSHEKSTR